MAPELHELVSSALKNAEENGDGDRLRTMSLGHQAADLHDCDAEIGEDYLIDDIVEALITYRINETPKGLPQILNQAQYEGLKHRLLDPVHAIRFAIHTWDLDFLVNWAHGDWAGCLQWTEWKDFK